MKITEAFEKLEISPNSNLEDVLSAYRTLSIVWHPDRFTTGSSVQKKAEIKQRDINEAFEALKKAFENGYQPSKNNAGSNDDSVESTLRTFDAVYIGGDPRATGKKIPCKIILAKEAFVIAFGEDRFLSYPKEDIRFLIQGNGPVLSKSPVEDNQLPAANTDTIRISLTDPEEVVAPFLVELKLQNDYFAKVLKKYMWQYYGLLRNSSPKTSSPADSYVNETEDLSNELQILIATIVIGAFILLLVMIVR